MGTVCLYRKWRSRTFEDLVGQDHITKTIQNAVVENRLAHAYLFAGPRGTGKTSTAKLLAKLLNCTNRKKEIPEPCNECSMCTQINGGYSIDIIEIDAASNRGIDEIRDLREKIKFAPTEAQYKVYIIDEVHMLTTEAFNALLKTLEEPPSKTVFVLATTEPNKLLPTVISRCQRFDFKRLGIDVIAKRLDDVCKVEDFSLAPCARDFLAKNADGSLRDALSLLDQVVAFAGTNVTEEAVLQIIGATGKDFIIKLSEFILSQNTQEILNLIDKAASQGMELSQIIKDLIMHYRDIILICAAGKDTILVALDSPERELLSELAKRSTIEGFTKIVKILGEIKNELRWNDQSRMVVEMGLLRLALLTTDSATENINQRLILIEQRLDRFEKNSINRQIQSDAIMKPGAVARPSVVMQQKDVPRARLKQPAQTLKPAKTIQLSAETEFLAIEPSSNVITFEEISLRWPSFLDMLKAEKRTIHAVLIEGAPTEWNNGLLTVTFPANRLFHKETVEEQSAILSKVFKQCFGTTGKIVPVLNAKSGDAKDMSMVYNASAEQQSDMESIHDKAVQSVLELFGGKIVDG